MPFIGAPVVVQRLNDEQWRLVDPVTYQGQHDTFIVPAGFVTDFASVPRVAVWLIPRFGRYTPAAILHDWLCELAKHGRIDPVDADGLFRRVMRELGVPPVLRWLMWTGVRWSATTQAHRRPGWWKTAPQVLALSLAAAPVVIPAGLAILFGLALYTAAERLVTLGSRGGELTT